MGLKVLGDAQRQLNREIQYTESGSKLYHYTSEQGMRGILRKDGITFHFTKSGDLEDTSEGKEVLRCYNLVCKRLLDNNDIDKKFCAKIEGLTPYVEHLAPQNNDLIPLYSSERTSAYICCLSTEPDSAYMWGTYSNTEGYNLILDDFLFSRRISIIEEGYSINFRKVFYEEEEKIGILVDFIKLLYKYRKSVVFQNIEFFIRKVLTEFQYIYKEQKFCPEREIRAFVFRSDKSNNILDREVPIKTKNNDKKYIEIKCEPKSFLRGITIGPMAEKVLSKAKTYVLLNRRGYNISNDSIINSKHP